MQSLGSLLIADGVCSVRQIEDAIQNQVILGGRMGTNLVELGVIDEETLARYLSRQHELPAMFGEKIEPDAEALKLLRPDVVDRLDMIPFLEETKKIQVLCVDPRNIKSLDEVAFTTGLIPDPIVIPEIRFWQLLKRYYGIDRQLRYIALDTKDFMAGALDELPAKKPVEPSVKEDLVSEVSFAKLYQRRDGFPVVTAEKLQPLPSEAMPLLTAEDLEIVTDEPAAQPPGDIERRVWLEETTTPGRRKEDQVLAESAAAAPSMPPPEEDPEDSPLTFEEASHLLTDVTNRSAIARFVLRYACSIFKRAMLFTVHRGVALGWDAIGEGIDRWSFRSVMVPLDSPSVFQLVAGSRAHYLGGLTKTKVNIQFLRAMGKKVPLSAFVLPILVRGRVVNLLYADNGHKVHSSSNIGELLILAQRISRCYESLFEKKWQAYQADHQEKNMP
ncbi:MAG: general secretion pathway protein GspE [Deltaproteobacteria bacterium]|nr:general secretion pathway protein GspE [Deltaproteobacteria bacterium]